MIVQLYIKRRTPQSNWMRSFIADNQIVLSFFFLSLFLPEHCAGSGSGKLETETTFIVHCQCLTADTELVASVGCSSPFLSAEWDFFFFCWCWFWSSGPAANCSGGWAVLGLCSRWSCQSEWPPPSVPHNEPSQSLCSSGSRWRD